MSRTRCSCSSHAAKMSLSVLGSLVLASLVAFCVGELEATETPNERHGVYFPRATTSIPSTLSSSSQAHITSNPLATQSGCIYFTSVVSSCEMAMTSFEHRPASEQASCLCYIGTKYTPASLDDAISDCASAAYISAYQYYTVFSLLEDFCLNNGSTGKGNRTQPTTSKGTTLFSTSYTPTLTQSGASPTATSKGTPGIQGETLRHYSSRRATMDTDFLRHVSSGDWGANGGM